MEATMPQIRNASAADAGVIAALIRELGDDCYALGKILESTATIEADGKK